MQRLGQGAYFVSGPWSGSFEGPNGVFSPQRLLEISNKERRGCFVEWVEKASFAQLNKLFKIDVVEWADSVLFSDKNLLALINIPSHLSSYSVVRLFTQKKKTAARHVQRVRILPLASPSSSSASSSSSPSSLSYNDEPKAGVDWPVPSIICEKEKEEEKMASDLRVGFCERSSVKLTLPTITTIVTSGLDEKPSFIEDISYHETRKPLVILGKISEDSFECLNFSPLHTKRILVKVDENPNQSFMSRLPYGTPDTAITHIIYLKDYTTFKTMEVLEFVTLCDNESASSNDWKQLEP
ncbi:hypothetical protein CK203_113227 [Vitis vinifera]|uniref:Uncharacterized protein n=1 Tax=Vitis vinifera TaxID=29760 RepID=A0A438DPV6_VITVI|nr:hypothetical protein CK203_113227 [Vitis vinifera]